MINSGHHNLPTYEISLKSNSWICAVLWWPLWKWRPVEIFPCQESIRDFIPDIEKFLAVAISKMAPKIQHFPISSKFDMWIDNDVPNWINSGHHNLPTYEISLKSNSWICAVLWWPLWKWRPGRLWSPELISDNEKFLPVAIFKMATTIPHKFNCSISMKFHK
jgi:hypothetical protein